MRRIFVCLTLLTTLFVSAPAWSGLFSSCDSASSEPKPDWVSNLDYSLPGYYFGVGAAEKDGRGEHEQDMASESDAKQHLSEQIEVTIKAENEQSTRVSNQKVQKDALSKVVVSTQEVLRGLQIKSRWVEKETCKHYTLMVVSKASVIQVKQEKLMKERLEQFKKQLAEGTDHDKNRDIKVRRKYLGNAQILLANTNFDFLPDEHPKPVYEKQLSDALDQLNKDSSQVQGRMALFAINKDGTLSADLIGKMLDQLRSGDSTTDRLMVDCYREEECITLAKERGFAKLTMLTMSTQVVTSQMGALKGTLTVSKTVYDIESRKVLSGPDAVSTQVIGWSGDELDWSNAAEKAMQSLK